MNEDSTSSKEEKHSDWDAVSYGAAAAAAVTAAAAATAAATASFLNIDETIDHLLGDSEANKVENQTQQNNAEASQSSTAKASSSSLHQQDSSPKTLSLMAKLKTSKSDGKGSSNLYENFPENLLASWDPMYSGDWDLEKPSGDCINRIRKDIFSIFEDPVPGICVLPDFNDITKLNALITGPFDTPYEGGFFHFLIRFPPTYPFKPPRVKLMTTSNGTVRFNPNLYKNGKVCLSILGTWWGPSWLPSQSLASVLMSIQSLLNSKPYHNEPGFEKERVADGVKNYNKLIQHETLRVAVCENLEKENYEPKGLRELMVKSFIEYYDYYHETCVSNLKLDNTTIIDSLFHETYGKFRFGNILERIRALKIKFSLEEKTNESDEEMDQ